MNQFRIELPRIIFSREGSPFLEKDIKKLSIQLIYIYIKRNKQVVTQLYLRVCLCTTLKPRTISRDLSHHVSGCFQLSGIIFSPEGIERAGLKRNESPSIHPSPSPHVHEERNPFFVGDTIAPTTLEIAAGTELFPFVTRYDVYIFEQGIIMEEPHYRVIPAWWHRSTSSFIYRIDSCESKFIPENWTGPFPSRNSKD